MRRCRCARGLAHDFFRIVIAHGMTDLVTPYSPAATSSIIYREVLTAGRVTLNLYPGGHMMYLHAASRAVCRRCRATLSPLHAGVKTR
jgi:carboxypeptidase C (cathepsin A)